jgi:2-dehydropantoate 2-reductase
MKFLILGAGALGGYFGARLLAADKDVTFMLRPGRAAQIARAGLVVRSPQGDLHFPSPKWIASGAEQKGFDVIILGCKAYDLDASLDAIAPTVGMDTMILPLLNGMRHIASMQQRFGAHRVLGGLCQISAALDATGAIEHFSPNHTLIFGELAGGLSSRTEVLDEVFSSCRFDARHSPDILQDMWEKWVLIASLAGITCLMRASVGDIVSAGGAGIALQLFEECCHIALHNGINIREPAKQRALSMLTAPDSLITASMYKDIEKKAPTEADHSIGDLLRRGAAGEKYPLLELVWTHLQAYEIKRRRDAAV